MSDEPAVDPTICMAMGMKPEAMAPLLIRLRDAGYEIAPIKDRETALAAIVALREEVEVYRARWLGSNQQAAGS